MSNPSRSDLSQSIRLPKEGRAAIAEFDLDPNLVHLNHGSYGAVPKSVLSEQERWRYAIERDPTGFFQDIYPIEIRRSAEVVAACFGGVASEWVFCENATAAVNSVLASISLRPGDEILTTSHAYGAVLKAAGLWAERRGAKLKVVELPAVLQSPDQVVDAVTGAFTSSTRLLIADHITSSTAAVLPVERLARSAREAGIATLIDGAHGPGQVELDVRTLRADWYTGNAHKWFFAPRGCGLLWTAPERQETTRPAVLSHGTDQGYSASFDWIGTRDVTPWLCVAAAQHAFNSFGGKILMERNRRLAADAAAELLASFRTEVSAPLDMRGAMAALSLGSAPADPGRLLQIRQALRRAGIVVSVSTLAGRLWLRISAQVYNKIADYRRCSELLNQLGLPAR